MPDTALNRHDDTSSDEESDGEVVVTSRRKSFGIRVAQTPQQAQQQVLSQIGNLANERQANEVVVQQTQAQEKSAAEKLALEQREKLLEAQNLAKAQQAAALQAAAARVAQAQQQAQAQGQAQAQAQQQALQAQQQALQKAQEEAKARALQAQQQAQQQAQLKAQQAQAQAQAQQAQLKAQEEAKARALQAQQQAQQQAQLKAQQAQAQAQQQAQLKAQQAQAQAQQQAQLKAQQQAKQAQAQAQPKQAQAPEKSQLTGQPQKGALSNAQVPQQEIQAAAGPKWSRTPGKNQIAGPQPEQPKIAAAVAPPSGKTALRQTAQIQEQELAANPAHLASPVLARKPHIQAEHLAEKFVEKPEEAKEKMTVQKGHQLEGAVKWAADSQLREQMEQQTEKGPKAVILQDDACWQTQRRVPVDIQQPQVGKIQIPELNEKEVQRTIVAQPASYHKVKWNEFPEELKVELAAAPKTKTQDWVPVNDEANELQRSIYKPARMAAIWPPPQDELVKEDQSPLVVKANEDTAWIQQDQNGVLKQAVWGKTSRINRVWPPPENETALTDFGPQHMPVVQWPPPEAEAHEREQVEVLQKHIPTKKMERQWPPPPPQYQVVESSGEIETRYNPAEVQATGQQQQVIRTVIRSQ